MPFQVSYTFHWAGTVGQLEPSEKAVRICAVRRQDLAKHRCPGIGTLFPSSLLPSGIRPWCMARGRKRSESDILRLQEELVITKLHQEPQSPPAFPPSLALGPRQGHPFTSPRPQDLSAGCTNIHAKDRWGTGVCPGGPKGGHLQITACISSLQMWHHPVPTGTPGPGPAVKGRKQ